MCTKFHPRGLPLTEISYTSAEISNKILKSPAKSEIFRETPKSLKSLPKSAKSEIPKSREISSEITKSLLKSRNFCKMGGEVGVF